MTKSIFDNAKAITVVNSRDANLPVYQVTTVHCKYERSYYISPSTIIPHLPFEAIDGLWVFNQALRPLRFASRSSLLRRWLRSIG